MKVLPPAERRDLRARAHSLGPVVIIGNGGLTPGVTAEVERSLKAHELIKIRAGGMAYGERESVCNTLCEQTGAAQVQHIGRILVLYRKRPRDEASSTPVKPRKKAAPPGRSPAARSSARAGSTRKTRDATRKTRGARPGEAHPDKARRVRAARN